MKSSSNEFSFMDVWTTMAMTLRNALSFLIVSESGKVQPEEQYKKILVEVGGMNLPNPGAVAVYFFFPDEAWLNDL